MDPLDQVCCGIVGGCLAFAVFLLTWEPLYRRYQYLQEAYLAWRRRLRCKENGHADNTKFIRPGGVRRWKTVKEAETWRFRRGLP
jgi:hypothetical protein